VCCAIVEPVEYITGRRVVPFPLFVRGSQASAKFFEKGKLLASCR
jgi:hypothetical protein